MTWARHHGCVRRNVGAAAALLPGDSLVGGILGGVGAFGLNVGIAGTVFDGAVGLFGSDSTRSRQESNSQLCGGQ